MSTPSNPLAAYFSTLQEIFQEQARWRREKAKEYPDDDVRNQAAANIFDRLAATAEKVPPDVLAAFVELVGDEFRELEALQEMLRQVGYLRHGRGFCPGINCKPEGGSVKWRPTILRGCGTAGFAI